MVMKTEIIHKIFYEKVIAIVRGVYGDDCVRLAKALLAGGVKAMEVTFDQSRPESLGRTADSIKKCQDLLHDQMIFGAGTVTTSEMVGIAKNAGAQFIVSPNVDEEVIKTTVEMDMVSIPGGLTATEILQAYQYGADFVKLFPASIVGPAYVKALCSPINHVPMIAVGGVSEKNAREYLSAGAVGVGIGGNLVNKRWVQSEQYEKITEIAKQVVDNVRQGGSYVS